MCAQLQLAAYSPQAGDPLQHLHLREWKPAKIQLSIPGVGGMGLGRVRSKLLPKTRLTPG